MGSVYDAIRRSGTSGLTPSFHAVILDNPMATIADVPPGMRPTRSGHHDPNLWREGCDGLTYIAKPVKLRTTVSIGTMRIVKEL